MFVQRNQAMSLSLGTPVIADMFMQGRMETITEPNVFHILELAGTPIPVSSLVEKLCQQQDCSNESAAAQIESLLLKGVLAPKGEDSETIEAVRHWEERGWLEALILHARTCDLTYSDAVGASNDTSERSQEPMESVFPLDLRGRGGIVEGEVVALNASAGLPEGELIEGVLMRRRTGGPSRADKVTLFELSGILRWANEKGRENRGETWAQFSSNPAALRIWSSFCCLETFVVVANVEDVPEGIYFYDVSRHELVLQRSGDFRRNISEICIGQPWPMQASFGFMIACDWQGYQARYKHARAYRNLLINAGELAQRYLIGATASRLANFITPALRDKLAADLFGLQDSSVSAMYSLSFA
jgi:SagB-type dehydrogenase family enzyme